MSNLIGIIKSESEWPKLISKLRKNGSSIRRNNKSFVKKISNLWYVENKERIFVDEWDEKLPGSIIKTNGRDYIIHGIVHDGIGKKWETQLEYKKLIKEKIEDWDVICEQGIKEMFSLDYTNKSDTKEMNDVYCFMAEISPDPEKFLQEFIKKTLKNLWKFPFIKIRNLIKNDIAKEIAKKFRSCKTKEDLKKFRQDFKRILLPEPLLMNSHSFVYPNSKYKYDNLSLRSGVQAKEIIEYAEINDIDELHALVGYIHEPQIKYFLQHQEKIKEIENDERYINSKKYIKKF